jgi:hypothetical protein
MARLDLDDMVPSYPAYAAKDLDSTASGIDSGDSMLGDREAVVSNTRFVFDEICFDSKPHRHTVASVSAKKRNTTRGGTRAHHSAHPLCLPPGKPRPNPTGHEVDAAAFLDPSRPMLAASSMEARSLPDAIPTAPWCSSPESPEARFSQIRTGSAVARTANPFCGYGTSGVNEWPTYDT